MVVVGSNYSAQLQTPRRTRVAAPWPSARSGACQPVFQARSYACPHIRIGSAMNFVLQPWQLLLAILAVGVPQVSGCTIASPAWRRRASAHGRARRQAGHKERPYRGRKNRLPYSHLPPLWKAISDCASAGETPPTPTNAFAAESGRTTTISVGTGVHRRRACPGGDKPAARFGLAP